MPGWRRAGLADDDFCCLKAVRDDVESRGGQTDVAAARGYGCAGGGIDVDIIVGVYCMFDDGPSRAVDLDVVHCSGVYYGHSFGAWIQYDFGVGYGCIVLECHICALIFEHVRGVGDDGFAVGAEVDGVPVFGGKFELFVKVDAFDRKSPVRVVSHRVGQAPAVEIAAQIHRIVGPITRRFVFPLLSEPFGLGSILS